MQSTIRSPLLVGLSLLTAALPCLAAGPEEAAEPRALEPGAPRHVRPVSVTEQLAHCRTLVESGASSETLASCFDHAAFILKEGMRLRKAAARRSEAFEAQLDAGAREIAMHIEALSFGDRARLRRQLLDLDETIASLRADLSRTAAADHVQLSLISRGGISLGNWQAGFLYSVTEWAKSRPGQRRSPDFSDPAFSTVTGASAGAVNGFAAAVEGCRPPNLSARDSLYYQVWVNLGVFGRHGAPGLFPGEEGGSTALSLFTNDALDATLANAQGYIETGEQLPSCSVDLGFVVTHLDPTDSPVHVRTDGNPILTTKKLKEKFTVRLSFSDAASPDGAPGQDELSIVNIGPTGPWARDQIYYAGLGHTEDVPLRSLMIGVRASGAFPGAFPPVPLTYTQYVPGSDGTVLSRKRVATFIDGGILDNTPVGLAVSLDSWRQASGRPHGHLRGLMPAEPRTYLFLEPLVRSWVRGGAEAPEADATKQGLFDTYLRFTRELLTTTTDAQLTNTAEQFAFVRQVGEDWTQPRLSVPERHMPITGTQFDHFMAFLERDFRVFDFYVGMADAYAFLEQEECLFAREGAPCEPSAGLRRLDAALQEANPNYRCIRAYYDSEESRVLERISTAQLPEECRMLRAVACDGPGDSQEAVSAFLESGAVLRAGEEDACVEPSIANHNFRALLAAMHNFKVWTQSSRYAAIREFDRFFEELSRGDASERFIYVDLPTYLEEYDGYMDAREVKRAFRTLIGEGVDRIASEQGGFGRYVIQMGGRASADTAFGRAYAKRMLGLAMAQSGLELTYGRRLPRPTWRWDTTFRLFNLEDSSYSPELEPVTGDLYLSTQATRIFSPESFLDFEAGLGWAAVQTLAHESGSVERVAFRSGPRSYLGLILLQQIYLGLNFDYYTVRDVEDKYEATGVRVVDNYELNLAAGWRFLF
jgi:predicted acylesterase/phospholipase RssA